MTNPELLQLDIASAHQALSDGSITVQQLVDAFAEQAQAKNQELNVYLEMFDTSQAVAEAQTRYDNGTAELLTGMPIALKDNILVEGQIASASSRILANHRAVYDSDVVQKLKSAGAIIMGRTNMDEFAMGSSTENSAYGPTKNPLDPTRVPGGSSGGSAASVAMGGAMVALGSDTGGSIRQPASFCGLVGLYPTYGAVSRYGVIAMGSSLDQIGPFAKTVADAEALYNLITGYTPRDAQSIPEAKRQQMERPMKSKRIGVPRAFLEADGVDGAVVRAFDEAMNIMSQLGYEVVPIELPHVHLALSVYYVVMPAEVSSNLARFDGIRYGQRVTGKDLLDTYERSRSEGFGVETIRRILLGTYVLSSGYHDAYYGKAQSVRQVIRQEFVSTFEDVDIIATPTTPTGAFAFGAKSDPLSMYMADIFTVPANIAGIPAITVPYGQDEAGMPLGVQFFGPHGNEQRLFVAGKDLESGV